MLPATWEAGFQYRCRASSKTPGSLRTNLQGAFQAMLPTEPQVSARILLQSKPHCTHPVAVGPHTRLHITTANFLCEMLVASSIPYSSCSHAPAPAVEPDVASSVMLTSSGASSGLSEGGCIEKALNTIHSAFTTARSLLDAPLPCSNSSFPLAL